MRLTAWRGFLGGMVSFSVIVGGVSAQFKTYAPDSNPGSGTCNVLPMGTFEVRCQLLVARQYLPPIAARITDVAFAPCSNASFSAARMQIRMTHTNLSTFVGATNYARNLGPCPIVVYNGPFSWTASSRQWSPLGTRCDFGYDGRQNVLIELRFLAASGTTSVRRATMIPRLSTYGAGAFSAVTGTGDNAGAKLELSYDTARVLLTNPTARIGSTAPIMISGAPGGQAVQVAASLGQLPLPLGPFRVCLSVDSVFLASIQVGPPVFVDYSGTVPASGTFTSRLVLPNIPALVGTCVYHAAVFFSGGNISGCTNTAALQINP